MPLRDHFRSPLNDNFSWDVVHGQWPALIVQQLGKILPPQYVAGPHIHLGAQAEIDILSLCGILLLAATRLERLARIVELSAHRQQSIARVAALAER